MVLSEITGPGFAGLPVLEVLKVGLSGFCFLLAFLGYLLLRKEQGRDQVRKSMGSAIRYFLNFSVILGILVAASALIPLLRQSPASNDPARLIVPSVSWAEEYPTVFGAVSNLLSKKPLRRSTAYPTGLCHYEKFSQI